MSAGTADEEFHQLLFDFFHALYFGNLRSVPRLGLRILASTVTDPAYSRERLRADIAFGLYIAGEVSESEAHLTESFTLAGERGSESTAQWCACALAHQHLDRGDVVSARHWLTIADDLQRRLDYQNFTGGRHSSWIRIALLEGDPDRAEALLGEAEDSFAALRLERNKAVSSAFRVGICRIRGHRIQPADLNVLLAAYAHGRESIDFDDCVSALWHALDLRGERDRADSLVKDYLTVRRPLHPPVTELRAVLQSAAVTA
jgi:hypothetical protein